MLAVCTVIGLFVCLPLVVAVSLFAHSMCGTIEQYSVHSPDKLHRAVFFSASCGATTPNDYGVSVLLAGEPFTDDTEFNVFSVSAGYPASFGMRWKDAETLEVKFNRRRTESLARGGVRDLETHVGSVRVVYVE